MAVFYSRAETAYASALGLAFVLSEFALPELWPWYRRWARWLDVCVYGLVLLFAPSVERFAGLFPLWGILLVIRSIDVGVEPRAAGGSRVFRLGCLSAFKGLSVMIYAFSTAATGPSFPNPSLGAFGSLARVLTWTSVYLFMVPGGTAIVRWVLDDLMPQIDAVERWSTAGAKAPPVTLRGEGSTTSAAEMAAASQLPAGIDPRLGRIIGDLERLIVLTLVARGQYAATGIVVAAKSIARHERTSESRAFADYYLIGTLTSILVALAGGVLLSLLEGLP